MEEGEGGMGAAWAQAAPSAAMAACSSAVQVEWRCKVRDGGVAVVLNNQTAEEWRLWGSVH